MAFRPARVNRLLGVDIATDEQRQLLERVGIATEPAPGGVRVPVATAPQPLEAAAGEGEALLAVVPTWRRDLQIEADVAEEVARVRGYEVIPGILPHTPMPPYRPSPLEVRDAIREALAGAGVSEVVTYALVAPDDPVRFGPRDDGELASEPEQRAGGGVVTVTNPLSSQHSVLRQSLLGSLLEVVGTNRRHGRDDVAVFEVGKGYGKADGGGTREWWRLGIALAGSAVIPSWNQPSRPFDLDDAKGLVELICRRLGFDAPSYEPLTGRPEPPPRPDCPSAWSSRPRATWSRVVPESSIRRSPRTWTWTARSSSPSWRSWGSRAGSSPRPVERRHRATRPSSATLRSSSPRTGLRPRLPPRCGAMAASLLEAVELFDVYRGRPLEAAEKSLAWRLRFQAPDRTLTEAEIDGAIEAIHAGLAADVGGRIRG